MYTCRLCLNKYFYYYIIINLFYVDDMTWIAFSQLASGGL